MGSIMSLSRPKKSEQGPEPISLVLSEDVFLRWTQIRLDRSLKANLAEEKIEDVADPFEKKYNESSESNIPEIAIEDYKVNEAEKELSTDFLPLQNNEEQSLDQNVKEEIPMMEIEIENRLYNNPWDNAENELSILELLGSGDFHSDQIPNSDYFLNSDNGISESKTEVDPEVELSTPAFPGPVVAELPSEAAFKDLTLKELNQMAKKALNELPSVESLRVSSLGDVHTGAVVSFHILNYNNLIFRLSYFFIFHDFLRKNVKNLNSFGFSNWDLTQIQTSQNWRMIYLHF
jgi:hypothetical protein